MQKYIVAIILGVSSLAVEAMDERIPKMIVEIDRDNINRRDKYGCTPLMTAADLGDENGVSMLIVGGADVWPCSQHGTALQLAGRRREQRICELIIERMLSRKSATVFWGCISDNRAQIEYLNQYDLKPLREGLQEHVVFLIKERRARVVLEINKIHHVDFKTHLLNIFNLN
jgi:hypothetical protein